MTNLEQRGKPLLLNGRIYLAVIQFIAKEKFLSAIAVDA